MSDAVELLRRARDAFRFWGSHPKPLRVADSGTYKDIEAFLYAENAGPRFEEYWRRPR